MQIFQNINIVEVFQESEMCFRKKEIFEKFIFETNKFKSSKPQHDDVLLLWIPKIYIVNILTVY